MTTATDLHELGACAGYSRVEVLPVENDLFGLYRLDP